ncbi:hypothetical protein CspeluHIS016_0600080 [Cutaneotrichosporon spelunceum]|uniref:2-dehydropantoate 2-reductase n=1 Tax=Cutaneotrichosporon spelunceum TaxID=1672016 RepID=A0AAD3YCZ2_9TREE|nr:hypothetical protein CspeluHIS016_0600080 [Cutaneotrichosporon spelunceum]
MSQPVDVLLIGLGAIGTVYSYILERSGKARVTAVARSNYDLYASTGVRLETGRFGTIQGYKPSRVCRSQADALDRDYALCIVCTKSLPDVLPTTDLLWDALHSGKIGAYVLIQNGLDVEKELAAVTRVPIVSCVAWISVMTSSDGAVVKFAGVDKLGAGIYRKSEGKPSSEEQAALDLWLGLVKAGEGNTVTSDDIRSTRTYGHAPKPPLGPEHHAQIKKFYREVVELGFKTGLLYEGMIVQPSGQAVGSIEDVVNMDFDRFIVNGSAHKWSMLLDVENGRPFEVEVVVGSVVRLAHEHGFDAPRTEFMYTLLKGLQQSILEERERNLDAK